MVDGIYNKVCEKISQTRVYLKEGFLRIGEKGSIILNHTSDPKSGLEKTTKLALAVIGWRQYCVGSEHYKLLSSTLKSVKDVVYGTKFFMTFPEHFIKKTVPQKNVASFYSLKVPRKTDNKSINWVIALYAVGDIFCLGKFIQKSGICSFSWFSRQAAVIGSYKVFGGLACEDIPVFNTLLDKPKDFCIFVASFFTLWDCIQPTELNGQGQLVPHERLGLKNLLKATGAIGKIILISLGSPLARKYPGALCWIDMATCGASYASDCLKKLNEHC